MMMMMLACIAPSHEYTKFWIKCKWNLSIFWFVFLLNSSLSKWTYPCEVVVVGLRRGRGRGAAVHRAWARAVEVARPDLRLDLGQLSHGLHLCQHVGVGLAHCLAPHHGCMMYVVVLTEFTCEPSGLICQQTQCGDVCSARVGPLLTPHWWRRAPLLSSHQPPPAAVARHMDTGHWGHDATCGLHTPRASQHLDTDTFVIKNYVKSLFQYERWTMEEYGMEWMQ